MSKDTGDNDHVRDQLANERTYLAWLRTGLSTMGFGVVIAKLRYLFEQPDMTPTKGIIHASDIGICFAVIGLFILTLSGWRYIAIADQIQAGRYRPSKRLILFLSGVVIVLGVLVIGYLLQDFLAPQPR